jgi:hypothetical protein
MDRVEQDAFARLMGRRIRVLTGLSAPVKINGRSNLRRTPA